MLPQNTFIKEGNICNDHEVITGHVYKSPALEKIQSEEGERLVCVLCTYSQILGQRGILEGKWIISQLLRSSEADIHLSNTHFWTSLYLISAPLSPFGTDTKQEAEFTAAGAY